MNLSQYLLFSLQIASCVFAFAAALLWFKASTIKTPSTIDHIKFVSGPNGGMTGPLAEIAMGVALQGTWNRRAATCASAAAAFQALAIIAA